MEYIEREAAENIFWDEQQNLLKWKRYYQFDKEEKEEYDRLEEYRDKIKTLPDEDAAPVRHGKWIMRGGRFRCSKCNEKALLRDVGGTGGFSHEYEQVKSNHCPNCGAMMDGEEDE